MQIHWFSFHHDCAIPLCTPCTVMCRHLGKSMHLTWPCNLKDYGTDNFSLLQCHIRAFIGKVSSFSLLMFQLLNYLNQLYAGVVLNYSAIITHPIAEESLWVTLLSQYVLCIPLPYILCILKNLCSYKQQYTTIISSKYILQYSSTYCVLGIMEVWA